MHTMDCAAAKGVSQTCLQTTLANPKCTYRYAGWCGMVFMSPNNTTGTDGMVLPATKLAMTVFRYTT